MLYVITTPSLTLFHLLITLFYCSMESIMVAVNAWPIDLSSILDSPPLNRFQLLMYQILTCVLAVKISPNRAFKFICKRIIWKRKTPTQTMYQLSLLWWILCEDRKTVVWRLGFGVLFREGKIVLPHLVFFPYE